ncbi:MAG TPA: CDP-diacylglycerol--serine O-phosphatidyltransferase [Steroidobacteraceae bacterium]|nr:CDP-diacylglycerol--serine O-phosphatidyltransferase [Steroidobacteraceae bacterium]
MNIEPQSQNPDPRDEFDSAEQRPGRGVYLLPNLITTASLFSGFYAIVAAIDGHFSRAAMAIFAAMICDGLDGRIARWTNTQSAFGKEYDSLSDMVAFGLTPSIVAYQWGVERIAEYGKLWERFGWLASFFYAVCAALRLARFNVREAKDKRYFEGLPSPSAAACVAGVIWVVSEYEVTGLPKLILCFLVTASMGALMVSKFSYWSGKDLNLRGKVPWASLALVPLGYIFFVAFGPAETLLAAFGSYAASAPSLWVWRRLRRRRRDHG